LKVLRVQTKSQYPRKYPPPKKNPYFCGPMRLKTIELKGFKSFGNATTLHFNEDVVGVVGPNGSGKSNIVDAFRWVLGEQRTSGLRLDKMQDVLFNGTKTRRPANACSVTLTFDNDKGTLPSEYRDVSVARHLYRNGNSEYRLNGVPCRLKDITSLLSDTGIASNSYAIIALDMVDDILSDKDHARRKMFEQAAGISKFKQRKKEVQNKLKASEQDLERVQDLLFEISGNLKELEKQAKKARSFNKLREKYKEQRITLARLEVLQLKESNQNLENDLRVRTDELGALKAQTATLDAELQKSKQQSLKEEENLNQSQKEVAEIVNQLKDTESELNLAKQALEGTQNANDQREKRLAELKQQAESVQQRIEYLENQVQTEKLATDKLEASLEALQGKKSKADESADTLKKEHEDQVIELRKLEERKSGLEQSIFVLQSKVDSINGEVDRLIEEDKIEKDKHLELEQALLKVSENFKKLDREKAELVLKEEKRKSELLAEKARKDDLEEEQKTKERKLDSLKNERGLLKSMLEKLEGYPDSIKHLSSKKEWRSKAVLLSELVYCPDDYRPAVEAVLAPVLDHYVVPDWKTASEGIEILRSSQKGKAQFILLDAIETETKTDPRTLGDFISAVSVIEVDGAYQPLFNALLQGVYISKSDHLPDKTEAGMQVVVSADGRIIRRESTAEGGSADLFSGKKIGRKKALEKLDKQIRELEKKVDKNMAALQQSRVAISKLDTDDIQKQLTGIESKIAEVKAREAGILATQTSGKEAVEKRENRLRELETEKTKLLESVKSEQEKVETVKENLRSHAQEVEKSKERLDKALSLKGDRSEEYNQKNIEFIRQQNKLSGFEKELSFQTGRLNDLQNDEAKTEEEKTEGATQIKELNTRISKSKEALEKIYVHKKEAESALSDKEQKYFSSRNAIFEREKKAGELNRKAEELQSVIDRMKEKNREVEFKVRGISERLSVEFGYELRPDSIKMEEDEENLNPEDLRQKVERLKARLTNFGEVNPLALEAFEEMKTRYDDIQEQKKDIENARDSLQETIREIETTAKERYVEAFERIRFNFINVSGACLPRTTIATWS
jgi:chromosome segregation protein